MSLPNVIVMPGDNAINPFTIPGTNRRYSCAAASAISVIGDDALTLCQQGWVSSAYSKSSSAGTTTARPLTPNIGQVYSDTTLGTQVIYTGKKQSWQNAITGALA